MNSVSPTGILGGLLRPHPADVAWRLAFLIGLAITPALFGLFGHWPRVPINPGYGELVAAGLLVGIGTRLGSGCTSGHGVCGLARLSPRSLAATALFMAAGFATVYIARHVLSEPGYGAVCIEPKAG
ncbi:YeeE/YedE family protein [Castellaniella caeni]|uniref:YeeE/YedE family protein n=1 Tax=Castellaniella caeni TaxID=266123 RepID=UPI0011AF9FB2|nr:YeeE/YedE family protein [Castellaniella caeni]